MRFTPSRCSGGLSSAYHALKGDIRSGRIIMHSSGWLNASWSVFAHAIKAEAGELHLATRAFSLPQFMQFLLNGGTTCPAINSHAPDPHEDSSAIWCGATNWVPRAHLAHMGPMARCLQKKARWPFFNLACPMGVPSGGPMGFSNLPPSGHLASMGLEQTFLHASILPFNP